MPVEIAHLSDLHLAASLTWRELTLKRLLAHLNQRFLRRLNHPREILAAAVASIIARPPALVVITGDLVQTGLAAEFQAVAEFLSPLQRRGIPLLIVPGNHDLYGQDTRRSWGELSQKLPPPPSAGPGGIVNLPGLEILPLAQAVPSPPFFSYGQLNPEELTAAREVWRAPPGPDSVRLVCGHYPLTGTGRLSWLFSGLRGGQSLRDFLETSRVAGYLCGHIHHSQSLDLGQGVWQHVAPALPLRGVVRRYHCGDGKLTPIA